MKKAGGVGGGGARQRERAHEWERERAHRVWALETPKQLEAVEGRDLVAPEPQTLELYQTL